MNWTVPAIAGIQRTTAMMGGALTLALYAFARPPAMAMGCAVGAAVMIANLYMLTFVGRWMLALAARTGGVHRMGIVAGSLKLLFIVTVVALLFSLTDLNAPGFMLGALTQPGAIFIETWRVSTRVRGGTGERGEGKL